MKFKSIRTFERNHIRFAITDHGSMYFSTKIHVHRARRPILIGFFAVPINNRIVAVHITSTTSDPTYIFNIISAVHRILFLAEQKKWQNTKT